MRVVRDNLWLCMDCGAIAVNGVAPGDTDPAVEAACDAGLQALGPHLVPDWDSETTDGMCEFSTKACDCCGSRLAGPRDRFAVLGPDETAEHVNNC